MTQDPTDYPAAYIYPKFYPPRIGCSVGTLVLVPINRAHPTPPCIHMIRVADLGYGYDTLPPSHAPLRALARHHLIPETVVFALAITNGGCTTNGELELPSRLCSSRLVIK